MRPFLVILLSIFIAMDIFPQNRSNDREPVAAGRFYSGNREALRNDLSQLFSECIKPKEVLNVRAIVSPHAGYVYSGDIAASAFSSIPKNRVFKNIFLIGSSHVMAFEGASIYNTGDFLTPLGRAGVNTEIANKLIKSNSLFRFPVDAHLQEHSLEVQIPFIQYYMENQPEIVPIIIGTTDKKNLKSIAETLKSYFTEENLFIISSDFSHYPAYDKAKEIDRITEEAILSKDPELFLETLRKNAGKSVPGLATSMCGWTSGLVLLYMVTDDQGVEFKHVAYSNSGDSNYGNKDEVVGYTAIALVQTDSDEKRAINKNMGLSFTEDESGRLIEIARASIRSMLYNMKKPVMSPDELPASLKETMGAFVTLKIDGNLRGCIGRFISEEPVYEVVRQMALASAFEDHRFEPLTRDEFEKVEIEISVLGPLRKIKDISEIQIGKHGIYIIKDTRSGTMLPQVATENNWTVEQFLGYTSRDKAGIGWTGWKDADIYVYEAAILEEKRK